MIVAYLLSLLIGVVLGMLGGGGAILTLPMLVYVAGIEPKAAIATSLFVVGSTSVVGAFTNARSRSIDWKVGLSFSGAAMIGAFAGGRLAAVVPAAVLLGLFAILMLVTAVAMLRGRPNPPAPTRGLGLHRILALGVAVGALSGLVGAGGGFLIVPALTLFAGLTMRRAIGTSLLVIALQSFAGFAGHAGHVALDWGLISVVSGASVIGVLVGSLAGQNVPATTLRRGFAWLVLAMGLFVIGKQV